MCSLLISIRALGQSFTFMCRYRFATTLSGSFSMSFFALRFTATAVLFGFLLLRGWSGGRAAHRSRSAFLSASLMPAIARLWRCFSILAAHLLGSVLMATYHAGNAQPDGDANDCRVEVIGEAEMEGAAFMAYLGRSPQPRSVPADDGDILRRCAPNRRATKTRSLAYLPSGDR